MENGKHQLSLRNAEKLSQLYSVEIEWILHGEEAKDMFITEDMIDYLKRHPELARRVRIWIKEETNKDKTFNQD